MRISSFSAIPFAKFQFNVVYFAMLLYGGIREGSLMLHLRRHYPDPFDYIEIDGRKCRVDHRSKLRVKAEKFSDEKTTFLLRGDGYWVKKSSEPA